MASPEHLERFQAGAAEWNAWRSQYSGSPDLSHADFSRGILSAYDLSGTHLVGTRFEACHLNGTSFVGAQLGNASFKGASMAGADLTDATMGYTDLTDLSLVGITGLRTVRHSYYSQIDAATLRLTAHDLHRPYTREVEDLQFFLRASGLDSLLLESFRSQLGLDDRFRSCFISYSHDDAEFAERLHDDLETTGVTCFLDKKDMQAGGRIDHEISTAIRESDRTLLCCSSTSLTSWWVDSELGRVLEKERSAYAAGDRGLSLLIPLDLDGFLFDWDDARAADVRSRIAVDLVGWHAEPAIYDAGLERIVDALRIRPD